MKPVLSSILSAVFFLFVTDLFSDEQKGKLYYEGTKVVVSANLNTQPEFVEKADKTIDAELFASRIMPFVGNAERTAIKEKVSKCDKIECVLSEAKQNDVAVVVRSEISFLPDSFKGTLKMYETEHGYLLAEVSKIGGLENPEQQYSEMVKDFVLESSYYFTFKGYSKGVDDFENFAVTPFNPITDFVSPVGNDVKSNIQYQESKIFPPERMTEFHDLSKIKDQKLISFYEEALRADRLGESDPSKSAEAWKKVSGIAQGEIKDYSIKRSNEWFSYSKEIKEIESLKENLQSESEFQLFPEIIIKMWKDFLILQPNEQRAEIANNRITFFSRKYDQVKKYIDERSKLFESGKQSHSRNIEAVSDPKIKLSRKIDMFLTFIKKYGAVDDDLYLLDSFIDKLPSEKDKVIAVKNIYNEWNGAFFKSRCKSNEPQSCIIAEQIYRKIKDGNEAVDIQTSGCKAGILELCASLAQTKLATPDDAELLALAEKSCALGSGKGCVVLANFYDIKATVKPKAKKELLYKVSCERGFTPACKGEVKLEQSAAVVKPQYVEVFTPSTLTEGKKENQFKEKKEKKHSEFLKTHPYFWYGFSSALAGVALGAISGYFGYMTNENYKLYNERMSRIQDINDIIDGTTYDTKKEWMDITLKYLDDGDKYKKIAIGTGIAGGALIITGTVLMIIKKPKNDNLQLTFIPSENGFMAGATFSF